MAHVSGHYHHLCTYWNTDCDTDLITKKGYYYQQADSRLDTVPGHDIPDSTVQDIMLLTEKDIQSKTHELFLGFPFNIDSR